MKRFFFFVLCVHIAYALDLDELKPIEFIDQCRIDSNGEVHSVSGTEQDNERAAKSQNALFNLSDELSKHTDQLISPQDNLPPEEALKYLSNKCTVGIEKHDGQGMVAIRSLSNDQEECQMCVLIFLWRAVAQKYESLFAERGLHRAMGVAFPDEKDDLIGQLEVALKEYRRTYEERYESICTDATN